MTFTIIQSNPMTAYLKYCFRNVFEWQLEQLAAQCGDYLDAEQINGFTDIALLENMNYYLRQLDCIPFTDEELNTIILN
jgi:hypothetical protein